MKETGPAPSEAADPARRDILGLSLNAVTMAQAVGRCVEAVERGQYLAVGVVNAAKVVRMQRDAELRSAVTSCGMVLADGQSVVWASHLLSAPLPERVAGIDLFLELLAEAERRGYPVYFLGARPDVLARMLATVDAKFPRLKVAGEHDGYFRTEDEGLIAARVRESGSMMLFLGMSSPKKELFLHTWGEQTGVHVAHGVGGSFDILAGVTSRAPVWWQRHGLEWLYRALQEPRRLGPRYLTTNLSFMGLVAREAASKSRRRAAGMKTRAESAADADRERQQERKPTRS